MDEREAWIYRGGIRFYDFVHHLQTLWTDSKYRRWVAVEAGINEGDRVLDVGTGTGLTAVAAVSIQPNCTIVGVDASQSMLSQAEKRDYAQRIKWVEGDIENLPFGSDSFNRIISCYGLGGVNNIRKAFKEIVRVASPGAMICVAEMVTPPPEYQIRRFIHKFFVEPWIRFFWGFCDLELPLLFQENGIEITKTIYFTDRFFGSTMLVKGVVYKSS